MKQSVLMARQFTVVLANNPIARAVIMSIRETTNERVGEIKKWWSDKSKGSGT